MEKTSFKTGFISVLRWIGWVVLVQFILINISASLYAYKLTHFYDNIDPTTSSANQNIFKKSWKLFTGPRYAKSVVGEVPVFLYDTVKMHTASGLQIDGWYAVTDSVSKGTVILFHGISGTKSTLIDEANEFHYEGYNVLMIDFRAHGNSDGHTTTIGLREAEEVKLAFNYISAKGEKNIFLFGSSMGAVAIARSVAKNNLHPAGIILEMPFESLHTYLQAKARTLGFPSQPFAFFTCFWIGLERGFNGFTHETTAYVKKIQCPVLVQWGALDNFVLRNETERIYAAIPGGQKKLVVYDNAQHESFLRKDPLKWRIEVGKFLASYRH